MTAKDRFGTPLNNLNIEIATLESALGGKFRISHQLGETSRSRTYSAVRLEDSHAVALKIFRYGGDSVEQRRVSRMMTLLADCLKIDHPAVVKILGCGCSRENHVAYLVMEKVEGPTLTDHLAELAPSITIGRVLHFLHLIAGGLDEIHSHDMIHRDIKPDNIFISREDMKPKIGDFGLSLTELDFKERFDVGKDAHGTPAYIAPEQIIGTTFDKRVDVYAFAMMTYHLLTRQFAYDFASERELLMAHIQQEPIPPSQRNPKWPEALDRALLKSLSKHPSKRHASAGTLMHDVEQALAPFTPLRLASWQAASFDATVTPPSVAIKDVLL